MSAAQVASAPFEVLCDTDDHQVWLESRTHGIGASEIGSIMGMDARSSAFKVYCEKTGEVEADDLSEVEHIRWGHRMEPVIAEEYRERTGRLVISARRNKYSVVRSTVHPWALASLDFLTGENDGELWPLEIKNVTAYKAADWADGTPDYYLAQLQQQMLVTGAQRGTSACCIGGNRLLWCDIDRDEVLVRRIVFHGEEFWSRLQGRVPPPVDSSEATAKVLAKLYPKDDGSRIELPSSTLEAVETWRALKEEKKSLESEIALLENKLKQSLGEAQVGVFASGEAISWKSAEYREHVVAASTRRTLRFHKSAPKGI